MKTRCKTKKDEIKIPFPSYVKPKLALNRLDVAKKLEKLGNASDKEVAEPAVY